MCVFILLALLGFTAAVSEPACQKGWEQGNNSCYKVVDFRTDWVTAWMYCAAMRTQLVNVGSQEEQNLIAGFLPKYVSEKKMYPQFWIDLSDMKVESEFQWMTFGDKADYTNWIAGQPDNNGGRPAENCVHINAKPWRHFGWNDHRCGAQLNFICETIPKM